MSELGDLFEETLGAPPPSRLRAEEVYTAGRRRRRRRMAAGGSALAVAVVAAGMVGATTLTAAGSGGADQEPPPAAATGTVTSSDGRPEARQIIQWSGAADRDHLYLSYFACLESPCGRSKSTVQLLGSDDGGRSWAERGRAINVINLAALGSGTLLATSLADAPNRPGPASTTTSTTTAGSGDAVDGAYLLSVSTDGGRTWSAALRPPPVDRVPPGGALLCWSERKPATSCTPYVFDPATRTLALLATQAPLATSGQIGEVLAVRPERPRPGSPLRLAGTDLVTGRSTTATSTNDGRTWTSQELPGLPACPPNGCESPELALGDQGTAYAVVRVPARRQRLVYRATGTGPWQRVPAADTVPYDDHGSTTRSFVTGDGSLVLCELVSGERSGDRAGTSGGSPAEGGSGTGEVDRCRFWAAPASGGPYRQIELSGLPDTVYPIRRASDGWYYTHSYGDNGLYGSSDGRRWTKLSTPDR